MKRDRAWDRERESESNKKHVIVGLPVLKDQWKFLENQVWLTEYNL